MKDLVIKNLIAQEESRQNSHIELIASENYVSRDVMEAQGSVLTNKYAEGGVGKRYYGGCEVVDKIEQLAIDRACDLFECRFANVQPHSGSQANAAAMSAMLELGDTVLAMSLTEGGHLTHGASVNFSGKLYDFVHYGVNEQGLIDYDAIQELATEHKPKLIIAGYSAYSRIIDFARFREIADSVGAYLMVDMAHFAGLVAGRAMKNPLEYADVVTTTTHKTLRGPRGGLVLTNKEDLIKKIDFALFPGTQGGPLMHVIAAKAICFKEAMEYDFSFYSHEVCANARMSADLFINRGYKVVSGGTDNHMFLLDFTDKSYSGKQVEEWLGKAGITVNKNTVPGETRTPFNPSGIRIGLAAITSRGFREIEIDMVMNTIADILDSEGDDEVIKSAKIEMERIALSKPIYPVRFTN